VPGEKEQEETMSTEWLQQGPSCDLDEHGDPKPVKYVKVTYDDVGPSTRFVTYTKSGKPVLGPLMPGQPLPKSRPKAKPKRGKR